jgi:glutamine synthetase
VVKQQQQGNGQHLHMHTWQSKHTVHGVVAAAAGVPLSSCNLGEVVLHVLQLKAIHLALVTSHRKLEGNYEALRQERVRTHGQQSAVSSYA